MQDYIAIINYAIKQFNLPSDIPIIAFGGSYPGELAAFLRIAFPNVSILLFFGYFISLYSFYFKVVDGSLASSAPVRYHPFLEGGTNSGAFYRVITKDFAMQDISCPSLVKSAFGEMSELFQTSSGREEMAQKLELCSPLDDTDEQLRLVNLWIENAFASLGMENYPYAIGALPGKLLNITNSVCIFNSYFSSNSISNESCLFCYD